MDFKLYSSPLQGFTDFCFRNNIEKYFGGIDAFYAPYIRLQDDFKIKSSNKRDILPDNNEVKTLIPQIMTNNAEEFLFVARYVQNLGYDELNWNLGCPYPMVTKRGLGSGLIKEKDLIDNILLKVTSESNINISVKLRLGYENPQEIIDLLPILNQYKLRNLIIHPRLGKQLYKGSVDLETFDRCLKNTDHSICYNGDINSTERLMELQQRFPSINQWAIGRGLIANPFLASMLKKNSPNKPDGWTNYFSDFHDAIFQSYDESLSGPSHIIQKMKGFWEYFSQIFSNPHKVFKSIKKAKNINTYHNAVREAIKKEGEGFTNSDI